MLKCKSVEMRRGFRIKERQLLIFSLLLGSCSCIVSCSSGSAPPQGDKSRLNTSLTSARDAKAATADWRSALQKSDELLKKLQYQQVADLLSPFMDGSVDRSVQTMVAERLAAAYFGLGDFAQAECFARQDESTPVNDMLAARACYEQGKYAWAIKFAAGGNAEPEDTDKEGKSISLAASLRTSDALENDLNTALNLSFQAKCYPGFDPALYSEGVYIARHALSTVERKVSAKDARVADALENLAALLIGTEPSPADYQESEKLLKEALNIRKETSGTNGLARANTLRAMGLVLEGRHQVDAAAKCYKEALSIDSRLLPSSCPTVSVDSSLLADATKNTNDSKPNIDKTGNANISNLLARPAKTTNDSQFTFDAIKAATELSKGTISNSADGTQDTRTGDSTADETPHLPDDWSLPFIASSLTNELEPQAGADETRAVYSNYLLYLEGLKKGVVIWRHEIPSLGISNIEGISVSGGKRRLTVSVQDPNGRGSGCEVDAYFWDGKSIKPDQHSSSGAEDPIAAGLEELVSNVVAGADPAEEVETTALRSSSVDSNLLVSAIHRGHTAAIGLYRKGKVRDAAGRMSHVFELTARLAAVGDEDLKDNDPTLIDSWLNAWYKNDLSTNAYLSALNDYGFFLYRSGQNDDAVKVFLKVIKEDPERAVAYLNLGDALWAEKRLPEARLYYSMYKQQMHAQGEDRSIPLTVLKRCG
jgi:tetratricopeptide (TPR) repeat protein